MFPRLPEAIVSLAFGNALDDDTGPRGASAVSPTARGMRVVTACAGKVFRAHTGALYSNVPPCQSPQGCWLAASD
jgi:hypothetical protein